MKSRTLLDRVGANEANRLTTAALALSSMHVDSRASRIYINEIVEAVENDMFLTVIELSTTLLEIWTRDLLVIRKLTEKNYKTQLDLEIELTKIDREIEGVSKGKLFSAIYNELYSLDVIDKQEVDWLKSIYKNVRNPMHHGISGRAIDPEGEYSKLLDNAETRGEKHLAKIFSTSPQSRANELEDYIYNTVIDVLEGVVNFIANHQLPKINQGVVMHNNPIER